MFIIVDQPSLISHVEYGFSQQSSFETSKIFFEKAEFIYQSGEGVDLDFISSNKDGFIAVGGEYWKAKSSKSDIKEGDIVRVIDKQIIC